MKYYDIVISLGQNCHSSMVLRNCGQQQFSYPLDWSAGILWDKCGVAGLPGKVELICNNFQGAFEREDFVVFGEPAPDSPHFWVKNLKTGLQYQHDFPKGETVDEYFPVFREKYQRRVNRLYEEIGRSERILFFFISYTNELTDDVVILCHNRLANCFPDKKIDLMLIMKDDSVDVGTYNRTDLNKNIVRYNVDIGHYLYADDCVENKNTVFAVVNNHFVTAAKINNMFDMLWNQQQEMERLKTELEKSGDK